MIKVTVLRLCDRAKSRKTKRFRFQSSINFSFKQSSLWFDVSAASVAKHFYKFSCLYCLCFYAAMLILTSSNQTHHWTDLHRDFESNPFLNSVYQKVNDQS